MNALFDLSGKVAIVTGSGRGLGKVMAGGLADFGAKVVVCDCTLDEAEATANEIKASGKVAAATFVDISIRQSCDDLIKFAVSEFGRVDILVNNAGIDIIKPAEVPNFCTGAQVCAPTNYQLPITNKRSYLQFSPSPCRIYSQK